MPSGSGVLGEIQFAGSSREQPVLLNGGTPEAGRGSPAVDVPDLLGLALSIQCLSPTQMLQPSPPFYFHPRTVLDPWEYKLVGAGLGDVWPQRLAVQSSWGWLVVPLFKNKLPSERLLEVVPHK